MLQPPLPQGFALRLRSDSTVPRSDLLFRRLLEKLPAGAYTCDAEGLITYYNQHAVRLWGRAPQLNDPVDRFCGSFKLYSSPDGTPIAHDRCWMALALREQMEYNGHEIVIERPDGSRLTALAHANPIHDESGTLIGAVNVLVDISERKLAEDALRAADLAKNEFLATMSHEIRTPINAVMGYVDLLQLEVAGSLTEGQRSQLSRIGAASRHLLSLINEVLDLAKVEARQMVIRREPLQAADAAESALAVIQPLAAAKGIVLYNQCALEPHLAYEGDEDRVRQTLINLLSNAIKFTEPGGRVEITCEGLDEADIPLAAEATGDRWTRFRVRDSGIGIAPDQLERIFEPFVQVEGARSRRRGGTGLGLTIARRLARLMGGDLTVRSTVGAGSEFTLWLPAAASMAQRVTVLDSKSDPSAEARPAGRLFGRAGEALLSNLDQILRSYVERLRTGHVGPGAQSLSTAQLANHAATLVAEIAVTLLALAEGDVTSTTFAAGSEIQRICAVEHGRQRGHLGWTEGDLTRGYDALWQEIARCVRGLEAGTEPEYESVLGAIRHRLDEARSHSLRALQTIHSDA